MRQSEKNAIADVIKAEIDSANTWLSHPDTDEANRQIANTRVLCAIRLAKGISRTFLHGQAEFLARAGVLPGD